MVYRSRPIDWNLMLNPVSAGLAITARSNENLGRAIYGAGEEIGRGIVRDRLEKESTRRFEIENQRHIDDLALRRDIFQEAKDERLRQRQAQETALLDVVTGASDKATQEAAVLGQVNPATSQVLTQASDALGGPQATAQRLEARQGMSPAQLRATLPPPPLLPEQRMGRDVGRTIAAGASRFAGSPLVAPATVGEQGIEDFDSFTHERMAADIDSQITFLENRNKDLANGLRASPLARDSDKKKAREEFAANRNEMLRLSIRLNDRKMRAAQAKKRETDAAHAQQVADDMAQRAAISAAEEQAKTKAKDESDRLSDNRELAGFTGQPVQDLPAGEAKGRLARAKFDATTTRQATAQEDRQKFQVEQAEKARAAVKANFDQLRKEHGDEFAITELDKAASRAHSELVSARMSGQDTTEALTKWEVLESELRAARANLRKTGPSFFDRAFGADVPRGTPAPAPTPPAAPSSTRVADRLKALGG